MSEYDDPDPLYDPFRRYDRYGLMGADPQTWWEYVRLALLAIVILPLKGIGTFISIFMAYLSARLNFLVPKPYRRRVLVATMKFWARATLFCVGFVSVRWRVVDEGGPYMGANTPRTITVKQASGKEAVLVGAVVSNHVGWADILVHMSHYFPSFVAREETASLAFIGVCCKAMDGLFVDRERQGLPNPEFVGVGSKVKARMQDICSSASAPKQPMLLFPEGTTTNGRYLLDFRRGAFIAGVPVQPVILQYAKGHVSPSWESIGGVRHIFLMMCNLLHRVDVIELPVYVPNEEEKSDPAKFAKNVRKVMLEYSRLIASDATFEDKRVYHAKLMGKKPPVAKKNA